MPKPTKKTGPKLHVNLLYSQGLTPKLSARFIKWLLSYGRIILIVIELMVLSTFAYRFKLDSDLADLKQNIEDQIPYINRLKNDEILIKQTQFKLTEIKKELDFTPNYSKLTDKLAGLTPQGIRFSTLNIETPQPGNIQFRLSAKAVSISDLYIFYTSLQKDSALKDITLTNIGFDEGVSVFTITGGLK